MTVNHINKQSQIRDFPLNFLFGAATAGHQVEGGNRWNDWWEYEQAGRLPFKSELACDHYNRFEEDFDLAQSWGHNCHRMSVEWSRIEPENGVWNEAALQHYLTTIHALSDRGIEAVVTLNHFSLPAWFLERGGWSSEDSARYFERFVEFVLERVGDSVKYWLTINEPTVYVQQAYINGNWPPMQKNAWRNASKVLRNLARAHRLAYEKIKVAVPDSMVSFAHGAVHVMPCDSSKVLDRLSTKVRDFVLNRLFFFLVAESVLPSKIRRKIDFVGLNYYTRCCVAFGGFRPAGLIGRACNLDHHSDSGYRSDVGWEVYPQGMSAELQRYSEIGLPILITENGIATSDDDVRCDFIQRHLRVLADAVASGVPMIGYLHWSLFDNFEWDQGTKPKFGLASVDYNSLERKPRNSAAFFSKVCRSGCVDDPAGSIDTKQEDIAQCPD